MATPRELANPGILAMAVPVSAGLAGRSGLVLGGLLAGSTVSGVLLAIFMSNSGGAWDAVGDPFKDAAGPSLNILIELMSMVVLVISPLVARCGLNLFD